MSLAGLIVLSLPSVVIGAWLIRHQSP